MFLFSPAYFVGTGQDDGFVTIKSVCGGGYLNVSGGSSENGANIQQWNNPGSSHTQFKIEARGGTFTIKARCSGKYINVSGGKKDNGANVQQWNNPQRPETQWLFVECGGGVHQQ